MALGFPESLNRLLQLIPSKIDLSVLLDNTYTEPRLLQADPPRSLPQLQSYRLAIILSYLFVKSLVLVRFQLYSY